jgi:hypothetical protein
MRLNDSTRNTGLRTTMSALVGCLIAPALLGIAVHSLAANVAATEPATWQNQSYRFEFVGYDSVYDCDGLAAKVRALLLAATVAEPIKIADSCRQNGRPAGGAAIQISFRALRPAGPGDSGAFSARWQHVVIRDHRPLLISSTLDCELVQQFRAKLLPLLTVRNVHDETRCLLGMESPGAVHLEFDVLAPSI